MSANTVVLWDNRSVPDRCGNTDRGLTHSSDFTREQAPMKATQCSVDGCERVHKAHGLCDMHYQRARARGEFIGAEKPCSVDGCDQKATRRGWCQRCYLRWVAHGDPTFKRAVQEVCSIPECSKKHLSRGLCGTHYARWRATGDPLDVLPRNCGEHHHKWQGEEIGYRGQHERVRAAKGPASSLACVDCERTASEWSYIHGCFDERTGDEGHGRVMVFCTHLEHYEPRCAKCHRRYDRTQVEP